jgi:hypothetical protein
MFGIVIRPGSFASSTGEECMTLERLAVATKAATKLFRTFSRITRSFFPRPIETTLLSFDTFGWIGT